MILIIKHAENEGPGSIEEFFKNTPWGLQTVELSRGEKLPNDLNEIEAVISMGGPMNVYEEVTMAMVSSWINSEKEGVFNKQRLLLETYRMKDDFKKQTNLIYLNFARIIQKYEMASAN